MFELLNYFCKMELKQSQVKTSTLFARIHNVSHYLSKIVQSNISLSKYVEGV